MSDERRAFEGLVIQSLRNMETGDIDLDSIREATEEEKKTLAKIRESGFLKNLLAGDFSGEFESDSPEDCEREELACAGSGGTLFRSDDIDEETAQELDEADQEIIERRRRERREQKDGETS